MTEAPGPIRLLAGERIDQAHYRKARRWFLHYAKSAVASGPPDIRDVHCLKLKHSIRVAAEIGALAEQLNLAAPAVVMARVIGILHDVGRFEPYATYRTFVDADSLDHGALGARIVKEHRVLEGLSPRAHQIAVDAVRRHNRRCLPETGDKKAPFFCRLLRDADKLDNFRVILANHRPGGRFKRPEVEKPMPDGATPYPKASQRRSGRSGSPRSPTCAPART